MRYRTKPPRKFSYRFWVIILGLLIASAVLLDWIFLSDDTEFERSGEIVYQFDTLLSDTCVVDSMPSPLSTDDLGPSPEHPWIALVIDDFGPPGSLRLTGDYVSLPFSFTFAVLPGNASTVKIGRMAAESGREVIIHLPMEPTEPVAMGERYMLMVGSTADEIRTILDSATTELPMAVGLNNHMGSKATASEPLMSLLAQELKRRGMIFYDSWTGRATTAYVTMTSMGVPSIKRDIFLDNVRDVELIRQQLEILVRTARRRGWAVGSGHVGRQMLTVMQEDVSRYQAQGIRFVTVGELCRTVNERQPIADANHIRQNILP